MPKVKKAPVPPIVMFGSMGNYKIPLTQPQKDDLHSMAVNFTKSIDLKYPGIDYTLTLGPIITTNGCTASLVLQTLNLLGVLMDKVGDNSPEGKQIVGVASKLLLSLIPEDYFKMICEYYDGPTKTSEPMKIQGPEAKA